MAHLTFYPNILIFSSFHNLLGELLAKSSASPVVFIMPYLAYFASAFVKNLFAYILKD